MNGLRDERDATTVPDGVAPPRAGVAKAFRIGTDRAVDPADTIRRVTPFLDALGITRVANITGLDRIGLPVFAVTRPNSRSVSVSQGKGVTLEAAMASGLMESIENHHAERIEAPLLFGSYADLAPTRPVVDVARLARLTTAGDCVHDRRLWIEGKSLMDGGPCWLPYELVSTDYRLPLPPGCGSFPMTSNGLASGNHLLEALSHGLCELVERDALTLWQFLPERAKVATRVDLPTVDDPVCRAVLDRFEAAAVDVLASETTTDLGIPAFRCEISDRPGAAFRPAPVVSGSGCHPRREIALSRALTEAAQGRLTLISGSRDDIGQHWYDEGRVAAEVSAFHARHAGDEPRRRFDAVATWSGASIDDDLTWALGRLAAAGLEQAFAVDLTLPRFGIPVCRVVVPGLEAFHEAPGYTPGPRARRRLSQGRQDRGARA